MTPLSEHIKSFAQQLAADFSVEFSDRLPGSVSRLCVCGMGGSGIVGEIAAMLYPSLPITTHKSYGLPAIRDKDVLYLVISYSGSTIETRSSLELLIEEKLPCAVVAGGGALYERALSAHIPCIRIPYDEHIPARFALASLLRGSILLLENMGQKNPLDGLRIDSAHNKQGSVLAERIEGRCVLVYTPPSLEGLGIFWKQMLNESTKTAAFCNVFPELLHNEIESLGAVSNPYILMWQENNDIMLRRSIEAFVKICAEQGWPTEVFDQPEKSFVEQVMESIVFSYWTSLALADIKGIQPTETPIIEALKRELV